MTLACGASLGPDEYHMNVNNNAYTNFMTKKTFNFTIEVLEQMKTEAPNLLAKLTEKLVLEEKEYHDWKLKADKMRIPMNAEQELYEQHDVVFRFAGSGCQKYFGVRDPDL